MRYALVTTSYGSFFGGLKDGCLFLCGRENAMLFTRLKARLVRKRIGNISKFRGFSWKIEKL